jgi:hypothetical protein
MIVFILPIEICLESNSVVDGIRPSLDALTISSYITGDLNDSSLPEVS